MASYLALTHTEKEAFLQVAIDRHEEQARAMKRRR